jgi:hypothetical protein
MISLVFHLIVVSNIKTPTKEEKKRILDKVPTRTMTDAEWAEAQGWTHSEARQGNRK